MKKTEVRRRVFFSASGKTFSCLELSVWQFLRMQDDTESVMMEVVQSCDPVPDLNERQMRNFVRHLLCVEKESQKNSKNEWESPEYHIIEGQIMHYLHQPLSEIREWSYRYFLLVYEDLSIILWAKEYDKNRKSDKPDKQAIKQALSSF